ncbi:type VI secretion system baseplate subunit TssF [Burkholderia pyrrocinia]|uniref:type VI secretion system baseplate subunit TssF n=1 Tax=Burkholderia pyrrocinia TaxID=60550 RepID=UPI0015763EC3|nr:type VI secretion system baseplate subunit TssF [Burkholderia pyrrocinia]NTX26640.1 type VI secretion system baseplate subunit TssF [Burkholderia pyrrocinia]QVN23409.1 type VI secretion system baseplate subunit TssF [Burkholderia pyrrocinia]
MDPQLLDYYNKELVYMREMAGEFARQHPKIARRLGMHGIEVADPYVERLIEAFCFQSARIQIKLDAEFPRFTQRLLEVVYPNYVAPTPSMAVAQLTPTMTKGSLERGFVVPRDTAFNARPPAGETTSCEFRSSQDVTLWPIELADVRLTGVPPDIPALDRYLPPHVQVHGALRIRLRMRSEHPFSAIKGLDRLPFYLCGDELIASHLFELVHASGVATLTGTPGELAQRPHVVTRGAVAHEGLAPEQSLLPLPWNTFHGHNLLHEYFACPSRFYFFALDGLAPGLSRIDGHEAEIVVLLDRAPGALANQVDGRQLALFCTPVVNLFPRRTERVEINSRLTEFHLVADRTRPLDYEVFAVDEVIGQLSSMSPELVFRPLYQTLNNDEGNYGRYFSMRREKRLISDSMRKYGTRTQYIGTEVFLSLVDQQEAPYTEDLRYLSVKAWVTNRDLATLVPRDGVDDLIVHDSIPAASVGLIRPPTAPRPPFAERELAWRLIRQLGFNYMPLVDLDHRAGGQGLRDLLRLFVTTDDAEQARQIQGLVGSRVEPVTRRLPGDGPLVYGRGVRCQLTVDEAGFSGISPYLFGVILEHYLARHVSINSFTETELLSMQRGLIKRWPVRIGKRNTV